MLPPEEKFYTLQKLRGDTKHFNSGVMLWRNTPATQDLFTQWYQEWQIFQKQDQLAFVRALQTTQISVQEIPKTYNISPIDATDLIAENHTVYLLHCWGGMIASGKFREIAHQYYPHIVEMVVNLLDNRCATF